MKTYTVSVDSVGFCSVYTLQAKNIYSAKRKAKKLAIKDFVHFMTIRKEDF